MSDGCDLGGEPMAAETDEVLATDVVVEQVLDGIDDGSLPASFQALLPLVAAARRPPTAGELVREAEMVSMFHTMRRAVRHAPRTAHRRSLGVRIVVVAGLVSASTATAAAAAGRLPEPVQETAAAVLAKVGLSVPAADVPSDEPAVEPPAAVVPAVPITDTAGDAPTTAAGPETIATPPADSDEAAVTSDQPNAAPPSIPAPAPASKVATASADKAAADDGHEQSHAAGPHPANPDAPGQSRAPGQVGTDRGKDASNPGNGPGPDQPKKKK